MRVRKEFWIYLALLGVGVVLAISTRILLFSRFVFLLILVLGVCYLWTILSGLGIRIERNSRVIRQQVGQVFEEHFRIISRFPILRLWVEVIDQGNLPGKSGSRVLSWIGARQERSYLARTYLAHRGEYQLGPTDITSGDPLGLFQVTKQFKSEHSLLVLPYFVSLTKFPSPPGFLAGGRALHRRSLEVTPYAAGVREYTPGDPLSRIHWRSTARRGKMMVKEFDQDPQSNVWLILDAYRDTCYELIGQEEAFDPERIWLYTNRPKMKLIPSSFEYCVSGLASAAGYYISQGKAVGLASNSKNQLILSPERGERQFTKLLETFAFIQPDGDLPIQGLVQIMAGMFSRGSTVVFASANTWSGLEVAVDMLIRRDVHPVVLLADPRSFGGEFSATETLNHLRDRSIPTSILSNEIPLQQSLEEGFQTIPTDFQ